MEDNAQLKEKYAKYEQIVEEQLFAKMRSSEEVKWSDTIPASDESTDEGEDSTQDVKMIELVSSMMELSCEVGQKISAHAMAANKDMLGKW